MNRSYESAGTAKVIPSIYGDFPQLGMGINLLEPGEPMAMYHWDTDQAPWGDDESGL